MNQFKEYNQYVGVYGTLRKGGTNHHRLGDSKYIGSYTLEGFSLYATKDMWFPYGVLEAGGQAIVEIYKVNKGEVFADLDYLEGYPVYYDKVRTDIGGMEVVLYKANSLPSKAEKLNSGDWVKEKEELKEV